ncbi:pilus assembly protein TadG-related protein [Terricaulis silvestris]|uniref:Flp pilus assembly protein TadG n=1 Tax=Terricaulis silvestris TaxID=2686094 RepID=A0A6I6MMR4_9CAUL|nr:pilus assembly protein TadG-related protein [Terricaulis silvestris]QGZ96590.1 Flp pilus assembly protein TadG [Terricaulis silvestris]
MTARTALRSIAARFAQAERGAVAIYVALTATVTFGIVGLAVDVSRAMIVRSEAQAGADALALAAASQLDGTPSAIARANTAIANLVENSQRFASTGPGPVSFSSVRFLSGLPSSDNSPITGAFVTTDPLLARFVEVTTAPLSHSNTFLLAVGATPSINISTDAVAGCNQAICRAPPMMICNPAEQGNPGASFDIDVWRGRQIKFLHQGGAGASWAPGNFGYLEVNGSGANALRDALASINGGNICYGRSVTTEPGAKNGASNALNVRFGIYQNPGFGNASNNPTFAPDVNVRAMPRDLVFTGPANRFGNGHWNCNAYWSANFASSSVPKPAGCTASTSGYTRFEQYEYEIAHGLDLQSPANAANELADRRIIYVAVVNCLDENVHGSMSVRPLTYLKVFLTEPVNDPSGVEIMGEIVDIVQLGDDDGVLHDIVQLYR